MRDVVQIFGRPRRGVLHLLAPLILASSVSAWQFRRPIEVNWDIAKASDSAVAVAEFYSCGHSTPSGADVHVTTEEGKAVASRVLTTEPGDLVRVVFVLQKPSKKYFVYFGAEGAGGPEKDVHPGPAADDKTDGGLLMEMKHWGGGSIENYKEIEESWKRSDPMIGGIIIDRPFYGLNPFGPQEQTIARLTGTLTAPLEGEYSFAVWADDRGALYIDGQPVVFARVGPADIRERGKIRISRGKHAFLFYHVNFSGAMGFTVAWQRPDKTSHEVIAPEFLGPAPTTSCGPLEEYHKTLVADFSPQHEGECFFQDGYSQRYKFTPRAPKSARASYAWDFGDGQTSSAAEPEQIYLTDGVYPVKLTIRIGANSDSCTIRIPVGRDYQHLNDPPTDEPSVQTKIAEAYDVTKLPEAWLPRAAWLQQRAGQIEEMLAAASQMGTIPKHSDPRAAMAALLDCTRLALTKGKLDAVMKLWRSVGPASDLQPHAAAELARLLMWRTGDFDAAVQALKPYAGAGDEVKRLYGQALVLDQKAAEGRKILESFSTGVPPEREAALSGALARTIEFYINDKDWESGDEAWEKWQSQFPAAFLGGYSVVLRTRLMELKGNAAGAAKVAEAFALSVPGSSYAPQLLDRASKLLATADPQKSQSLHEMLKQRYPEDPLSQ